MQVAPQHEIYLVRHGETAWSLTGRHTGLTDLPLTEHGEAQARRLKERMWMMRFAHVFSSPLQRARRTGELAGFGASVLLDADLVEWNYGEYEGRTLADIRRSRPDWELFRDGCPGGESVSQITDRVDRVARRLRTLTGRVLIFSSGHVLRALAASNSSSSSRCRISLRRRTCFARCTSKAPVLTAGFRWRSRRSWHAMRVLRSPKPKSSTPGRRGRICISRFPGPEGLPAIEEAMFAGVPINVTLLFSSAQYLAAAEAYLRGVERRIEAGLNPNVSSVASVFISRWDVAVSGRVPDRLTNTLGIAIGRSTYRAYSALLTSSRWRRALNAGARAQRLLFASTGTKDPVPVQTSEWVGEVFYDVHLAGWLDLRPNLQYVAQPGGVAGRLNDVIFGIRVAMNF